MGTVTTNDSASVPEGLGGMSQSQLGVALAALGSLSSATYNANGTLATYVADGITWTLAYDAAGRISTETASTGTVRTYTYSATTGRLDTVTVA